MLKQYLKKEKIRLEKVEEVLKQKQTQQAKLRLEEIQKQKKYIKEAEICLYCAKR